MDISLCSRVALVTGAGAGIGKGCALELARSGAQVLVNDIDEAAGENTVEEITRLGKRASFIRADVSSEAEVTKMAREISNQFGTLHVLVNNAGFNLFKSIADFTPAEWDRLMGVDLKGTFLCTKLLLPLLKKAESASVVNIASVHAHATIASLAAYAAAKGGIVALVRSLAQELGPFGIRVNSVSPGFIDTPLMDRWLASEPDAVATMKRVNGLHPLGRIGTPQDIGQLIVFLASDCSAFITGTDICIDGGLTARLMH